MKYEKEPLTLEGQADLLIKRGLVANRNVLIKRLKVVNYYRLSGYLLPFRQANNNYQPGTTLDMIWRRYNFDRRLRILLFDSVERIEVAVRTRCVYHFVHTYGAFGHLEKANLPNLKMRKHKRSRWQKFRAWLLRNENVRCPHLQFISKLRTEKNRSSEVFVKEFEKKYGDEHPHVSLWMACELMTCETTMQFAYGMPEHVFKAVASDFGFADQQLKSWIKAIFSIRNACAHHSRLLDRIIRAKPLIPAKKREPLWHEQPQFPNDRVGYLLTVSYVWLSKISTTTRWKRRLFDLFNEYPEIPLSELGLPNDWRNHPLWK